MSRCFGCFQEIMDGMNVCPHCGFDVNNYDITKWTLKPGTILNDKYQIGRKLGEGGFGITYLAWDLNMQTKVAVKEYYPEGLASRDVTSESGNTVVTNREDGHDNYQEGMKRYVKEAATLSKFFDLPGIVTVKDFFYENQTAYIVMEFIDGISLKDYLKENGGKIKYDEVLKLLQPVIQSLSVVHKNNLLHRDISPDNIMIDKNGSVKLIDFGAARQFGENYEKSMTVVLKHGYAPVEQYSSHGDHGAWTDVYALCAVIYRAVTGVAPVESIDRLHQDRYVPVKQACRKIPKYIAATIDKGLSINPRDRHQSMDELYADLYISLKGRMSRKADSLYKKLRALLITIIVILVIGVIGGIAYKVNYDKIEDIKYRFDQVFGNEDRDSSDRYNDDDDEEEEKSSKSSKKKSSKEDEEEDDDESSKKSSKSTDEDEDEDDKEESSKTTKEASVSNKNKKTEDAKADEKEAEFSGDESATNADVARGIEVASQGVLNGYAQDMTVGDILNQYSDKPGKWVGYQDDAGQVHVFYQGYKDGKSFAVEFETYSNDTFRLTGASKDGKQIDTYSDFFQSILDEVWG